MKKLFAFLLTVLLCLTCVPMGAMAAEEGEMVSVAVKVVDGWGEPSLWAWADDGTNAFEAWPGEAMESIGDGWYYAYVPGFVQNIIVNANQDTDKAVQTEGIVVEAGKNVWITVAEDNAASISYEEQIAVPEYVEKFVVHAYVPIEWKTVNMWAWSAPDGTNAFEAWPGEAMKEGTDGWFTGKVPTWVNSLIINGNEGSVQTADIAIEANELWVTVYEDLTYELTYEDPNKVAEDITVHAQVPADWSAPCCWAWSAPDGTNAFAAWPGDPLTLDGEWYTIQVPGWINSVIINGNEGSVQTTDLTVETGKDIWITVQDAENATISYEEPATTEVETEEAESVAEPEETQEAEESEAEVQPEPIAETSENNNTGLVVGVIAVLAVIATAVVVVLKKKNNK